jgi:hypothetical protein
MVPPQVLSTGSTADAGTVGEARCFVARRRSTGSPMLAILGASLAMIGPGAWSVDARLFGRKHIEPPKCKTRSDNPKVWVSALPESISTASYHISGQRTDHLGYSHGEVCSTLQLKGHRVPLILGMS